MNRAGQAKSWPHFGACDPISHPEKTARRRGPSLVKKLAQTRHGRPCRCGHIYGARDVARESAPQSTPTAAVLAGWLAILVKLHVRKPRRYARRQPACWRHVPAEIASASKRRPWRPGYRGQLQARCGPDNRALRLTERNEEDHSLRSALPSHPICVCPSGSSQCLLKPALISIFRCGWADSNCRTP